MITTGNNIRVGEFSLTVGITITLKFFKIIRLIKTSLIGSFNNNSRNDSDVHAAFDMFKKSCDVKKESTIGLYKMLLFHEMCSTDPWYPICRKCVYHKTT